VLNLIGKNHESVDGNVSRKDARLRYFRINDAKSATEEPEAGNFGIKYA